MDYKFRNKHNVQSRLGEPVARPHSGMVKTLSVSDLLIDVFNSYSRKNRGMRVTQTANRE